KMGARTVAAFDLILPPQRLHRDFHFASRLQVVYSNRLDSDQVFEQRVARGAPFRDTRIEASSSSDGSVTGELAMTGLHAHRQLDIQRIIRCQAMIAAEL